MLWAIGLPLLVYLSNDFVVQYPAFFHVPITFGGTHPNGEFTRFGVDVVPSILFLVAWFATKAKTPEPHVAGPI